MSEEVFWRIVIQQWRRVVALDLHQQYQMDDGAPGFWDQPFWRLRERVQGLLDLPDTRLWHAIQQAHQGQEQEA